MELDNTIQAMQKMGLNVVTEGKKILKRKKKVTKRGDLIKGFDYNVTGSSNSVDLKFVFGKAKQYWQFVDEGVRGKGGYSPGKGAKKNKSGGGTGLSRGRGSKFKFKKNNLKQGVIAKWIKNKPLKLRGSDGKFMEKTQKNIKSAAFVIGRAIVKRGLERTQFFSTPFKKINTNLIVEAFSKDLENNLESGLEDITITIGA